MNDRNTYRSQFAAYFAGKLSAEEAAALEQALARDAKLAREAAALRPVIEELSHEGAADSAEFRLSPDRLALIRAAASKQIVEFPRKATASRRDVSFWRKVGPGLAASVAVLIGALSGFSSGRGNFEDSVMSFQLATEIDSSSGTTSSDADLVHLWPPAYGLDHYESWGEMPAWRATGIGFVSTDADSYGYYGLPGPRPAYLASGYTLSLQ